MSNVIQLHFEDHNNAAWWAKPRMWERRHYVTSISRPVENEALRNVYYEAKAHQHGGLRTVLTEIERVVLDADVYVKKHKQARNDHTRAELIADRVNSVMGLKGGECFGTWRIKTILADIDIVQRDYTMTAHVEAHAERAEQEFTDLVREVMREEPMRGAA